MLVKERLLGHTAPVAPRDRGPETRPCSTVASRSKQQHSLCRGSHYEVTQTLRVTSHCEDRSDFIKSVSARPAVQSDMHKHSCSRLQARVQHDAFRAGKKRRVKKRK